MDRTPLIEIVGGISLVTLFVFHTDLFDRIGHLARLPHDIVMIPLNSRLIIEIFLESFLVVSLRPVGALPEVYRILQFCEVHRTVETVHRNAVVGLVLLVVILFIVILLFWLWRRPVSCGLIRPVADRCQFFIDFPHVFHVLLKTFFLVLVDVSSLELINVILILFDVGLGLQCSFVMPEELLHVFAMVLHCEMLEKLDQHVHNWPHVWRICWINKLFGPKVKHDDNRIEDNSEPLRDHHESILNPKGHEGPNNVINTVHHGQRQVYC